MCWMSGGRVVGTRRDGQSTLTRTVACVRVWATGACLPLRRLMCPANVVVVLLKTHSPSPPASLPRSCVVADVRFRRTFVFIVSDQGPTSHACNGMAVVVVVGRQSTVHASPPSSLSTSQGGCDNTLVLHARPMHAKALRTHGHDVVDVVWLFSSPFARYLPFTPSLPPAHQDLKISITPPLLADVLRGSHSHGRRYHVPRVSPLTSSPFARYTPFTHSLPPAHQDLNISIRPSFFADVSSAAHSHGRRHHVHQATSLSSSPFSWNLPFRFPATAESNTEGVFKTRFSADVLRPWSSQSTRTPLSTRFIATAAVVRSLSTFHSLPPSRAPRSQDFIHMFVFRGRFSWSPLPRTSTYRPPSLFPLLAAVLSQSAL